MENFDIGSAIERQWSIVVHLQIQAQTYPSVENLEKLKLAVDAHKSLVESAAFFVSMGSRDR